MSVFKLKRIFRLCKTLWHQFPRLKLQYIEWNLFLQETKLKAKKLGHLDGKTAKNGYLNVPFSQKLLFKVKMSLTKRCAWSKNFSRLAKICSPRQLFSLSLLGQNAAWTNLLPVKKRPRENQYSSSSRKKTQENANNSSSSRCAAI